MYISNDFGSIPTISSVIHSAARENGECVWIITEDRTITYAEMDRLSDTFASYLADMGVCEGDTLAILLPNSIEYVILFCALAKLGAIQVPINTAFKGDMLTHIINDSEAKYCLTNKSLSNNIKDVSEKLIQLNGLIILDLDSEKITRPDKKYNEGSPFSMHYVDNIFDIPPRTFVAVDQSPDNVMGIYYTSGTTGPSKGVICTHVQCYLYASAGYQAGFLGKEDRYYATLPLFHIGGLWAIIYGVAIAGASAVLTKTFSASRFWSDISNYEITIAFLLGSMVNFISREDRSANDSHNPLKRICIAPSTLDIPQIEERFGVSVWTAYGSTEIGSPIIGDNNSPNRLTCGKVRNELYDVRIADENDNELPTGQSGELLVRPKIPFAITPGYWKNPEATINSFRNLWFHTGDIMYADDDGYYYFVDRCKDVIRKGGENISSVEVEDQIHKHPAVSEAAVFPVPSELSEDEVMAAIVLKKEGSITHEEIIQFLDNKLPYFMIPRYIDFTENMPKTESGKVKKILLKEKGITNSTWDWNNSNIKLTR